MLDRIVKRASAREEAVIEQAEHDLSGAAAPVLAEEAARWRDLSAGQKLRQEILPEAGEQRVRSGVAAIKLFRNTPLPHEHR